MGPTTSSLNMDQEVLSIVELVAAHHIRQDVTLLRRRISKLEASELEGRKCVNLLRESKYDPAISSPHLL